MTPARSIPASTAVGALIGALAVSTYLLCVPAKAHSWYSTTKDPETGLGCCGGEDCKPIPQTSVKLEQGGWRYLPTGELIPFYRVQQSHDFEFHRCEYLYAFDGDKGQRHEIGDTRCFFVPGGTM